METTLRAALIAWLRADPALPDMLNDIHEEAPPAASLPWLQIAASASADWSMKDRRGREIRIAIELHARGDDPAETGAMARAIEQRIAAMPPALPGCRIANIIFLRARAEQRAGHRRAVLIEHRFRLIEDRQPMENRP